MINNTLQEANFPINQFGRNIVRIPFLTVLAAIVLSGCASPNGSGNNRLNLSKKVVHYGQNVPKGGGHYKVGRPYQIANKWYRPRVNTRYDRVGMASWYGDLFHGRKTANGEVFDMDALTAAHPTLPLPTLVEVTNLANGRTVIVRVNDRGPYRHNRMIDLSRKAALVLGFKNKGTARVRVKYIGKAPMNGDDRFEKRTLARKMHRTNSQRYLSIGQHRDNNRSTPIVRTEPMPLKSNRYHTASSSGFDPFWTEH